jgi:hypothetical protein
MYVVNYLRTGSVQFRIKNLTNKSEQGYFIT